MISLTIEQFSCIKWARFQVAPVTVLIGPQGSGKSITTKLTYFFCDLLIRQYACAEKGLSLDEFKKDTARQFRTWFPPSAWGKGRFNINFSAEAFTVRILRRMSGGNVTDDVAITFSDFFNSQYEELIASYAVSRLDELTEDVRHLRRAMESTWRVREESEKNLAAALNDSYVPYQVFIPAGRAFFTSIGRLVAALEQGSSLDPVTVRFAKLFANIRDLMPRRTAAFRVRTDKREARQARQRVMTQLFGGKIVVDSESEHVETRDGRKVPFAALSSGQQELLPMWLLIDYISDRNLSERVGRELFYIEEPEAHLFPAAQSLLMDFLIGNLRGSQERRSLILTTHSPYILSKLNNYLKAGAVGEDDAKGPAVAALVPRDRWLTPESVKAYAIEGGNMHDLMTADGLIDGRYIDSISEDVSSTFSSLLDIQYPDTAA